MNIGIENGFLKCVYIRLKINSYKAKLLDLDSIFESAGHAEKPISLREAAATNSISGAHGYCPRL
ncbi:KRAB-A domain-containing protein 2-like [Aphis craccivora]|uniref:KRAB-A domain-containing protein 2-like n=1 Tax=Aphis craccivora TaxID=307492 RepID=A0A6G0ZQQ5_APHCR|nr:KRAB-A domain-containing protein 2-like [Aphis craccivora]